MEKKTELFIEETNWLGQEIIEHEKKTIEEKIKFILKLNHRHQVRNQNHSSQQYISPQNFCRNFQNKLAEQNEEENGMEVDRNRGRRTLKEEKK